MRLLIKGFFPPKYFLKILEQERAIRDLELLGKSIGFGFNETQIKEIKERAKKRARETGNTYKECLEDELIKEHDKQFKKL